MDFDNGHGAEDAQKEKICQMDALETPPVEQIAYMLMHRLQKLLFQLEVAPDMEKRSETRATLRAALVEADHLFKDAHYRAVDEARS